MQLVRAFFQFDHFATRLFTRYASLASSLGWLIQTVTDWWLTTVGTVFGKMRFQFVDFRILFLDSLF